MFSVKQRNIKEKLFVKLERRFPRANISVLCLLYSAIVCYCVRFSHLSVN